MTMDSAIVFSYTRAAAGREEKALQSFTEGMVFFGSDAHDGKCGEPISVMGTSGYSFTIIPGEYGALSELVRTEEFRELYTKTVFAVPDIGYEIAAFGEVYRTTWPVGTELALL